MGLCWVMGYDYDALLVVYKRIEQQYIECTFIKTEIHSKKLVLIE